MENSRIHAAGADARVGLMSGRITSKEKRNLLTLHHLLSFKKMETPKQRRTVMITMKLEKGLHLILHHSGSDFAHHLLVRFCEEE
jgi:hypothetical protein